jgi:hypothetical protein
VRERLFIGIDVKNVDGFGGGKMPLPEAKNDNDLFTAEAPSTIVQTPPSPLGVALRNSSFRWLCHNMCNGMVCGGSKHNAALPHQRRDDRE